MKSIVLTVMLAMASVSTYAADASLTTVYEGYQKADSKLNVQIKQLKKCIATLRDGLWSANCDVIVSDEFEMSKLDVINLIEIAGVDAKAVLFRLTQDEVSWINKMDAQTAKLVTEVSALKSEAILLSKKASPKVSAPVKNDTHTLFLDSRITYKDWKYYQKPNPMGASLARTSKDHGRYKTDIVYLCGDDFGTDLRLLVINNVDKPKGIYQFANNITTTAWVDGVMLGSTTAVKVSNTELSMATIDKVTVERMKTGVELKIQVVIPNRNTETYTFSLVGFTYAVSHLPSASCHIQ